MYKPINKEESKKCVTHTRTTLACALIITFGVAITFFMCGYALVVTNNGYRTLLSANGTYYVIVTGEQASIKLGPTVPLYRNKDEAVSDATHQYESGAVDVQVCGPMPLKRDEVKCDEYSVSLSGGITKNRLNRCQYTGNTDITKTFLTGCDHTFKQLNFI